MEAGWPSVIVVDTNIICYRCMASPYANAADAAWQRDPSWIVPTLWRSEFRNALAGALRQRSLTVEAAMEIASLAEAMLAGNEFTISTSAVLQLVASSSCSAYDCEFVALAQEQRIPLVTVDRLILRDFPTIAVSLNEFARR
jgi:predicted nucleic acid-binding protein